MQSVRSLNSKLNLVANALIPEALHPNHLTYLRLIAVPTLILFNYYHAHFAWMFIIVLLALLTDFFDGATARNRRQVTHLGTVLDPMADKLLALTALTILLYRGIVHWTLILWMCLMESHLAILPVTDSLGRLLGKPKNPSKTWIRRIAPNSYGKMKVLFYSISLCLLFLGPAIESEGMVSWGLYLAYAGVFFGALALVTYLLNWFTGED